MLSESAPLYEDAMGPESLPVLSYDAPPAEAGGGRSGEEAYPAKQEEQVVFTCAVS